jgi:hypothetical protein
MLADAILRPLKRLLRRGLSQAGFQVVRTSTLPLRCVPRYQASPSANWAAGKPVFRCRCQCRSDQAAASRRHLLDEPLGQCLGQRSDGELLLVAQDRAHRSQNVQDQRRGESGCVRLHRALLQSQTQTLKDRLYEPHGVREAGWISLTACHPNRVQAKRSIGLVGARVAISGEKRAALRLAETREAVSDRSIV